MTDKHGFLNGVVNWNNHRPLLLKALEATTGPVLELGMGDGSTRHLHDYCKEHNRRLVSIDNNPDWTQKYAHLGGLGHDIRCTYKDNWGEQLIDQHWSVVLVDNAPGESRWELIKRLREQADIMVIHDSEPVGSGNYMLDKVFGLFKYKVDLQSAGAWASAVSNNIDITAWIGTITNAAGDKFTISKYTMRPNKTVILSSNDNPDYLKYYPYVAWAWNQLGWDTLLFYLGKHQPLLEEYKAIKGHFDAERNKVIVLSHIEGYRPETIVQVSRLFGGYIYPDNRILMTGDVDMVPLSDYWQPDKDRITAYGHDLTGFSEIPMCYIAMNSSKWREVMRLTDREGLDLQIKSMLDKGPNAKSDDFEKWWSYDQQYITERLGYESVTHVHRSKDGILAQGRADRYNWEGTKIKGTIDAHMPRSFSLEATKFILNQAFGRLPEWLEKQS